ncbi:MAG: hypothetical protein MZW92_20965 [Comamonadaceae bacterium]|nr:hypothetical protein [Comamonadaceae bacterium]
MPLLLCARAARPGAVRRRRRHRRRPGATGAARHRDPRRVADRTRAQGRAAGQVPRAQARR